MQGLYCWEKLDAGHSHGLEESWKALSKQDTWSDEAIQSTHLCNIVWPTQLIYKFI